MRAFTRRTYRGPVELIRDICFLMGNRSLVKKAMDSGGISFGFRERLMMVVTEVNGCRYCSWYHSAQSIKAGLSQDELDALLAGQIPGGAPEEEVPALAYAQHWAQMNAKPEADAMRRLTDIYTEDRAAQINIVLRMIRMGNLLGNTLDKLLYMVCFGRLGLTERDAR